MHDAQVVRARDAARDLDHDGQRARADAIGPASTSVDSVAAVEELHDDVGDAVVHLALIEDLDHVRVGDGLRAPRLAPEPLADVRVGRERRVHHLDGAGPVDELVARPVDGRHAALAEHVLDDVAAGDRLADERVENGRELGAVQEAVDGVGRVADMALGAGLHDSAELHPLASLFAAHPIGRDLRK